MRLIWLILGVALLVPTVFWLWQGSQERSARAVSLSDRAEAPVAGENLVSAETVERELDEERIGVADPEPEPPSAPQPEEALRILRGRVVDAQTRLPLPGFELELMQRFSDAQRQTVTTDAAGTFETELVPAEFLALHVADPEDAELAVARALEPQVFEVPVGTGAVHEIVLAASHSPQVLEVDVSYEDGRPAVGALALFNAITDVQPFVDLRARVDAKGRARLGVWDPERFSDGLLYAWDEEGFVSDYAPIEAPFVPGVRRLVLYPAARVEVVVRDAEEQPVGARRVLLASELTVGKRLYLNTNDAGRVEFTDVVPGAYAVGVWQPTASLYVMEEIEVRRGEQRRLEIELEEDKRLAAVRGRVVDENGSPLSRVHVSVTPAGGWPSKVSTDEDGAFVFYSDAEDPLLLQPNVWSEGDVFAPESLRVEHDTHDVLFTRVRTATEYQFEVEVYDLVTGAELEHFVATIDRGPGTEEWSSSYAPRRSFELRVLEESRWRVVSHGYLVRSFALKKELDALAEGERLRVGLEPGLDHAFVVRDADTLDPLEGVLFRSESAGEVRSDARGLVHLRSDHWSVYEWTRDGYVTDTWDPDDFVLWDGGPVLLERVESVDENER